MMTKVLCNSTRSSLTLSLSGRLQDGVVLAWGYREGRGRKRPKEEDDDEGDWIDLI